MVSLGRLDVIVCTDKSADMEGLKSGAQYTAPIHECSINVSGPLQLFFNRAVIVMPADHAATQWIMYAKFYNYLFFWQLYAKLLLIV